MAKNTIYITGHRNPDSDSIISAMAYAYLKQQQNEDAIAVRIGELNEETQYILSLFGEFAPPYIESIYSCIRDIEYDDIVTCGPKDSLYTALDIMKKNGKKVIAVTDPSGHLLGISTMNDIVAPMMPDSDLNNRCIRETDIGRIADFISGTLVYRAASQHTNGHVHVMASCQDDGCKDRIVLTGDDEKLQRQAIENQAATLIGVDCSSFSQEIQDLAKTHECNLILADGAIYRIAKSIYYATAIETIMNTELTCFGYDDRVDDVKAAINNSRFRSYPVLDREGHIVGMISRYHLFKNTAQNLILVDHNELSQSVEGAQSANILEIIDHHRLGGIQTQSPTYVRNEKVGCCCTIIARLFRENGIAIPKELAGMMCGAIISDTVNFKSVTCTETDRSEAAWLAELGDIDMEQLAQGILNASAELKGRPEEIFHKDLKRFEIRQKTIAVGQCHIRSLEQIRARREAFLKVMEDFARDSECHIVLMCFTVVDGQGTYVLALGSEIRLLNELFEQRSVETEGFAFFKGMISRKQQIIPMLTEALQG